MTFFLCLCLAGVSQRVAKNVMDYIVKPVYRPEGAHRPIPVQSYHEETMEFLERECWNVLCPDR